MQMVDFPVIKNKNIPHELTNVLSQRYNIQMEPDQKHRVPDF